MNDVHIIICIIAIALCYLAGWYFIRPDLTRVQILREVKKKYVTEHCISLCACFYGILDKHKIKYDKITDIIPKFNFDDASKVTVTKTEFLPYWWDPKDRESRLNFLNWLIYYYKDDETEIE